MVILFFVLIGAGCEKDTPQNVCGVNNPLTNLNWLNELKMNMENNSEISSAEIVLYQWNNKDYIYIQKKIDSSQDFPNTVYDCEGTEIYQCGGNQPNNNCSTFFIEAQKIIVLWKK